MSKTFSSERTIETTNGAKPPVSKSYSYSYSTSSTSKTTTKNGKPETVTESSTVENTSGDKPTQFDDGFEELKRSILSGDAYRQKVEDIKAKAGFPHFKPQEGTTIIRPVRSEMTRTQYNSNGSDGNANTITKKTVNTTQKSSTNGLSQSPDMSSHFKTELHIPVRRHHNTFDDFFMNRWHENNNSLMDAEFGRRRLDWESRLDNMKRDFFHFSPFGDSGAHKAIDSSKTVQSSPSGKPEFAVQFDVKDFKPEEVNVSTKEGRLVITAHHEEKSGSSTSKREFKRTVDLPKDVQIGLMRSVLSKDGILSVTAPIKPPLYEPSALTSSSQVTQQHATALSTTPSSHIVERAGNSHDSLNYSMSIAGYNPEEITVSVEGRKVKVHAKHDEIARGKKTHNEMTKMFDLPPSVDPYQVRSYIKDGTTLYIEAHLRDDLMGKIHVVPVWHK